jgi:hypothetical protein
MSRPATTTTVASRGLRSIESLVRSKKNWWSRLRLYQRESIRHLVIATGLARTENRAKKEKSGKQKKEPHGDAIINTLQLVGKIFKPSLNTQFRNYFLP